MTVLDYRVLSPIWSKLPRCARCHRIAPAGAHGGQHGGCRRYACECGHSWNEAPKAWHILFADGTEDVVNAIVHDACFPNRETP